MNQSSQIRTQPWGHYDDIVVGSSFTGFGRSVTDAEITMMTAMTTGFHQPLHADAEWIEKHTEFKGILLPGPIIVAYAIGLLSATLVYSGITIAFLGLDKVRSKAPVYGGDTIRPTATVQSKKRTSNPARGIVELAIVVHNQEGAEVQSFLYTLMVRA
ncbi:MaoC/PaaZ C-terminal domain-containing protein [Bordetella sp. BOR01]|uniref:MaoC family dehydratase n=1 Tax=Bordetella sp. BOR01 TaxID=2854779 RepID=UPI001C4859AE|nr:MaoC/PaaZ C-terminal domain-containing protein [Bordetella sp. BOR01]MBV7482357.1 hypothetical protein [Bordetella sp. BOR01]